jgi:hypothetical protein
VCFCDKCVTFFPLQAINLELVLVAVATDCVTMTLAAIATVTLTGVVYINTVVCILTKATAGTTAFANHAWR